MTFSGGSIVSDTKRARRRGAIASAVALTLLAAACSGGSGGGGGKTGSPTTPTTAGTPQRGGSVVWALPAETSGGWCLPEAQLAISGIQIARAIYDPLLQPDEHEVYRPWLATSMTSNAAHTVWTIELRAGVKFHDGTDLTAQVVKNNLDAARGVYKYRHPLLSSFVYGKYVKAVTVTGPLALEVDTVPWTAFPAYVSGGRFGILAQAQLDDQKTCASKLIGTGPFMLKSWHVNDTFVAVRNPNYWRKDANGVQLPYLDQITFRPVVESSQTVDGIQAGNLDLALDSSAIDIAQYRPLARQGKIGLVESDKYPELGYTLFNTTVPPFDNIDARLAFAYASDRATSNRVRSKGVTKIASGPFGPGVMGYLSDSGYPGFDLAKAKSYVKKYERETGKRLEFTYLSPGTDAELLKTIALTKTFMQRAGMKMSVRSVDESQGINTVIGKHFQAVAWRNHAGFDPDTEYVWWHCDAKSGPCDNPVNFNGFNDPIINHALEDARASSDPSQRNADYETVNRQFAKMVYDAWGDWADWTVPSATRVHGIANLPLPDGHKPFPGLTSGFDPAGLWVSKS
jgi:peptide/nickel transport system substrate-binding protein